MGEYLEYQSKIIRRVLMSYNRCDAEVKEELGNKRRRIAVIQMDENSCDTEVR